LVSGYIGFAIANVTVSGAAPDDGLMVSALADVEVADVDVDVLPVLVLVTFTSVVASETPEVFCRVAVYEPAVAYVCAALYEHELALALAHVVITEPVEPSPKLTSPVLGLVKVTLSGTGPDAGVAANNVDDETLETVEDEAKILMMPMILPLLVSAALYAPTCE
jgi:hypothetical protein